MLSERIEAKWIDAFERAFSLCKVGRGTVVAILSETLSRRVNVELAELALGRLGARAFHLVLPSPRATHSIPVRSTGASQAIGGLAAVVGALAAVEVVIDCTVEGLLHAPELPAVLAGGARLYMISNEHPEVLERLEPDAALRDSVEVAKARLGTAARMHVTSAAGTDLVVDVRGAPVRGAAGFVDEPGRVAYWPGGLVLCFPRSGSVNGRVVLDSGDVNLTFKRYLESPVKLEVEDDLVVAIHGSGLDADLMRSYWAAWNDKAAYGVSHVGWGLNPRARWDALAMYDKAQINGTELRAFAGNFLFSTGANEHAGRFTQGHFDLPMRNCSVALDGAPVVAAGVLVAA
ncbi:MAG: peptidase M29 [Burkholderiales bacterium]